MSATRLYLFQKINPDGTPNGPERLLDAANDSAAIRFATAGEHKCTVATTKDVIRLKIDAEVVPVIARPAKVAPVVATGTAATDAGGTTQAATDGDDAGPGTTATPSVVKKGGRK